MFRTKSGWAFLALLVALGVVLVACGSPAASAPTSAVQPAAAAPTTAPAAQPTTASASNKAKFKVAFIYPSPIGDMGWSYNHDQARKKTEAALGIETAYAENVIEGSPDAERVIRDFAQKGYNAIFACSFGYLDAMVSAAKDYPNVYFSSLSGYKTAPNLGAYTAREYQARYLTGIVAGMMTKGNLIGYVAGVQIPDVVVEINSFTLGVRSVNPNAKVRVVWTNSWYDPAKETDGANALLDAGADILTYHANTASTLTAAAARGKFGIGYPTDMSKAAPDYVLTSADSFYENYYIPTIKQMMAGTWKGESVYWGIKEGLVGLSPYNKAVPQNVKDAVEAKRKQFADGSFEVWWGPITGQNGEASIPASKKLTDEEIRSIDWFVQGVEGTANGKPPVAK